MESSGNQALKVIIIFVGIALGICVGLLLSILGCAIYNRFVSAILCSFASWWPLFAFFAFIFTPIPTAVTKIFVSRVERGDKDQTLALEHFGAFLSAFFAATAFGIIALLLQFNAIVWQNFLFQLFGGLVILFTLFVAGIAMSFLKKTDSAF